MAKEKKAKRKRNKFFYFFRIYELLLLIAGAYFLYRTYATLVEMDENDVNKRIETRLNKMSDSDIDSLFVYNENVESKEIARKNIRNYIASDAYDIKKKEKNHYAIVDKETNQHLFTVKFKTLKTINKLGLINYDILEDDGFEKVEGAEFYHTKIVAPSDYTIYVNDKEIEASDSIAYEDFSDAYNYVDIGSTNTYILNNLTMIPEIVIQDGDETIDFDYSENIEIKSNREVFDTLEDAGVDFDALSFCANWALFMTDDLNNQDPLHGYDLLAPYFIDGSDMQNRAYQWATETDITFTSIHTLLDPPFTDIFVGNVIKYNHNAYSVDVRFDKNMLLETNETRVDHFNNRLFIIEYDGVWKVINMQGVKDE